MARVFCRPCAEFEGAWTHAYDLLLQLYASSSPRLHEWVDRPEDAEVILLCNPMQREGDAAGTNPIRRRFPEKTFVLSEQWTPVPQFAGIYANAPQKALWRGRFRTGSYALYHPDFRNPYVQRYWAKAPELPDRRELLFSFSGRNCHPVRERLFHLPFRRSDIAIRDTSSFNAFRHGTEGKDQAHREYFELCVKSKYVLCPRGVGPNSVRLFETLQLGIAPIILADDWIPCEGPAWTSFALFLAENDLEHLEDFVAAHEHEFLERGREARRAHDRFFGPQAYFNYLVSSALSIQRSRLVPERVVQRFSRAYENLDRIVAKGRTAARRLTPARTGRTHHPFTSGSAFPAGGQIR